jgi:DNA-binding NtrC family response regulator
MPLPVSVLVIDDEEVMRDSCRQILRRRGYAAKFAADGPEGLRLLRSETFDLVLLDLMMPGLSGLETLQHIKAESPDTIVIVITGHATVSSAVSAMRTGAYDLLSKPFTPEEMTSILNRALEKRRLVAENVYLRQELTQVLEGDLVLGVDPGMREIYEVIGKVAPTDATVLITGESGTGKELIARATHRASPRKDGPFITVDCGSLVPTLFESELFGHVKGSFTDAVETRRGKLELANGGTIFFDEIGNISVEAQAKLLRAVQEREITKVGDSKSIKIDVRIIAATNRDLKSAVAAGTFRDDLYYRLNVVSLRLPPLRERKDDIPGLVEHFIAKYNRRRKKSIAGVSEGAMRRLADYSWPGNIRELENVMERAVILADHPVIGPDDIPALTLCVGPSGGAAPGGRESQTLAQMEKECILRTLQACGGNKTRAAESLGIDRKTLHLKLKAYGLRTERSLS